MKNRDFIIIVIALILVFLLGRATKTDIPIEDNRLDSIQNRYDSLQIQYNLLLIHTDSLISNSNHRLDSIETVKNNTIYNYERRIKDLSDVTIVSDDSVTRFISSRISNR